jgi:hypothetical protein
MEVMKACPGATEYLMLRNAQGLALCQAAHAWEATLVIRGLTQGQALQNLPAA